ncbi:MAG: DUF2157 domain-containing protein [Coriobacteriales bacterium]|nr:DUF2157 domain-containing protein [Coriobacteriales bacterium]
MTDTDLQRWVADRVAEGLTPEQIYLELLQAGHTLGVIENAFKGVTSEQRSAELQQRVVRIVLVIGAVLVGAGVFSFIAANWDQMPDWLRIAVIIAGMLVFSVGGFVVREHTRTRLTGEALLLIGSIIFGAGIFLVAQIYNVQGNWPDGFMLWMFGTLAMATAMRSTGLYVLGLILGIIATIGYPVGLLAEGGLDPYLLSSPLLSLGGTAAAIGAGLWLRRGLALGPKDRW